MPKVLWQPIGTTQLVPARCSASGRDEFSTHEAHYRARQTILNGTAEMALVMDQGQLIAKFERTSSGDARQTAGPEIL